MAKRARGSVRPGQRRPIERRAAAAAVPQGAAPVVAPRPSGLTEAETRRAAEIEAQLLAEERAAEAARRRPQTRTPRETGPGGGLALRAEVEYAYVGRDVKEITRIAALLLTILLGLWLLIDVAKVISIG